MISEYKKLKVDNNLFFYRIREYNCGEYGITINHETIFYTLNKIEERKKFIWFGKVRLKTIYKKEFTIAYNIENEKYTKEQVRKSIYFWLDRMKRKEEINKGNII